MVHIDPDFPSKRAFIEAMAAGREISVYQPGPFPITNGGTGVFVIEAPAHYHKWYQAVLCENCRVIKTQTAREQKEEYAKKHR